MHKELQKPINESDKLLVEPTVKKIFDKTFWEKLKRTWVANLAYIIKIAIMLNKTTFNGSIKVERIRKKNELNF